MPQWQAECLILNSKAPPLPFSNLTTEIQETTSGKPNPYWAADRPDLQRLMKPEQLQLPKIFYGWIKCILNTKTRGYCSLWIRTKLFKAVAQRYMSTGGKSVKAMLTSQTIYAVLFSQLLFEKAACRNFPTTPRSSYTQLRLTAKYCVHTCCVRFAITKWP